MSNISICKEFLKPTCILCHKTHYNARSMQVAVLHDLTNKAIQFNLPRNICTLWKRKKPPGTNKCIRNHHGAVDKFYSEQRFCKSTVITLLCEWCHMNLTISIPLVIKQQQYFCMCWFT